LIIYCYFYYPYLGKSGGGSGCPIKLINQLIISIIIIHARAKVEVAALIKLINQSINYYYYHYYSGKSRGGSGSPYQITTARRVHG
jgi:hypothetical protein